MGSLTCEEDANIPMTVAIVLNPHYAELAALVNEVPVWAVDSSSHRPVAERLWRLNGMADSRQGITLFKVADENDPESNCLHIIGEVDMHHGVYSTGSALAAVKVIGASLSSELRAALASYGLVKIEITADGFIAKSE